MATLKQREIEKLSAYELNIMYVGLCVSFIDAGRRQMGIIREFQDWGNVVTIQKGNEVFEVPRRNVYV